jgi:hypothetical protein
MKFALAFVFLALCVYPAVSEYYPQRGVGTVTCAEFAELHKDHPELERHFFSWAQGWMSGFNMAFDGDGKQIFDLSAKTIQEQQIFIRSYCDENPLMPYYRAVRELLSSLPLIDAN